MAAFKVLKTQFQQFIDSRFSSAYDGKMKSKVNERHMQTKEGIVDTGNDIDADNADIGPSYDEEPMAKVQSIAEHNVSANVQQHAEQPKFNNKGWVDHVDEQCHDKRLAPQRQKASDYDNYGLAPQLQKNYVHNTTELGIQDNNNEPSSSKPVPNVVPTANETNTSLQELELLFSPMYEEYLNGGNQGVSKSSALYDNLQQQDTQPTLNVQPTLEPIIPPIDVNAEEINSDQAENAPF
ncbi:hypothetical protein Tco_0321462 [Tanacetum coccineum]